MLLRFTLAEKSNMKKVDKKIKMSYEPEADILRVEVGKSPIDYAFELGNVIVHFNKKGIPVYFEVLEAAKFLKQASTLLTTPSKRILTATR